MLTVPVILILIALICFLIEAFSNPTLKVKLTPLGLAFIAASMLVSALG